MTKHGLKPETEALVKLTRRIVKIARLYLKLKNSIDPSDYQKIEREWEKLKMSDEEIDREWEALTMSDEEIKRVYEELKMSDEEMKRLHEELTYVG